jgi:hypothetical protein
MDWAKIKMRLLKKIIPVQIEYGFARSFLVAPQADRLCIPGWLASS